MPVGAGLAHDVSVERGVGGGGISPVAGLSVVLPSVQEVIVFGEVIVDPDLEPGVSMVLGVRGVGEENVKFGGVVGGGVSEFDYNVVVPE